MKDQKPGPSSYNTAGCIDKMVFRKTIFTVGKDQRKEYFETKAKKSISPGPDTHKLVEKAFDKICMSSMISKKRH